MSRLTRFLKHSAEAFAALMLAALFATFLLQIFSRYALAEPIGWTLELCLTLWVWIVFFGNAFVVRERDHVSFDILYHAVSPRARRWFALIGAAGIAATLAWSLLPTLDYIDWMKIRKSATLRIPMREVFSIYALFLVVVIGRYLWRCVDVWRNGPPADEIERLKSGEPL